MTRPIITFEKGWGIAKPTIKKFLDRVEDLSKAIDSDKKIVCPKTPQEEFSEVYNVIFEMANQKDPHNLSQQLFDAFRDLLTQYFNHHSVTHLEEAQRRSLPKGILKAWAWRWQIATWVIRGLKRYFQFLDRYYIKSNDDVRDLETTGYQLYHTLVFEKFEQDIPGVLLDLINEERDGIEIDREMVGRAIQSFVQIGGFISTSEGDRLNVYERNFERRFLEETTKYYQTNTVEWLALSTSEYLKIAEKRIEDEQNRLMSYIYKSTTNELNRIVFNELLMVHQTELLDKKTGLISFFEGMVGTRKKEAEADLGRLYNLYLNLTDQGIKPIAQRMQNYIAMEGQRFVDNARNNQQKGNASEREMTFIKNLLDLHTRFHGIVTKQFNNHHLCDKALGEGFKDFINLQTYVAERLAGYSHTILKGGRKEKVEISVNDTLENVVKLYDYIHDKDYFELAYQRHLADRLINDLSESNENEKAMIGKLKLVGGNASWCRKLENMFKDLETSEFLMRDFSEMKRDDHDVSFTCRVCTFGQWETEGMDVLPMPDQVKRITLSFKKFYEDKFSGRTLDYRMDKGKAELRIPFRGTGPKTLVVSPHQMSILLKFNKKTVWEHTDLQMETNIPEHKEEFQNALTALAHPRIRVLSKQPNSKESKPGDKYKINEKFKHARQRVTVPAYFQASKKKKEENAAMRQQIMKLREHQIDASIVRTMKIRGKMEHKDLIPEVIRQLTQFQAKPVMLKKRIATLIDQEFIRRDPNNRTTYHYIA